MGHIFQPPVLFSLSGVLIVLGIIGMNTFRRVRERELQCHQELRIREMEHEKRMKELEIELEKAKGRSPTSQAA